MPDWLTHLLMLLVGVPLGGFFNFLVARRKQAADEEKQAADGWQAIAVKLSERVAALEARIDVLQAQLSAALQTNAALVAENNLLKSQQGKP